MSTTNIDSSLIGMDEIKEFESQTEKITKKPVINVSHWDPGQTYNSNIRQILHIPIDPNPVDYFFTYEIERTDRIKTMRALGMPAAAIHEAETIFFQSGTIAIVNLVNFLKQQNCRKVCLLEPIYFSVHSVCEMCHLEYETEKITFINDRPVLPYEEIIASGYDAVWLTSPIYSMGACLDALQIKSIEQLLAKGIYVICDECLAVRGEELIRHLPLTDKLITLYSPHKAMGINGIKFAAVLCHKKHMDFFEYAADILSGSLTPDNQKGIFHYLSANFDECVHCFSNTIRSNKILVQKIAHEFPSARILPHHAHLHLMVAVSGIHASKASSGEYLRSLISSTNASLMPGSFQMRDPSLDFAFRVNLLHDSVDISAPLYAILQYMNEQ